MSKPFPDFIGQGLFRVGSVRIDDFVQGEMGVSNRQGQHHFLLGHWQRLLIAALLAQVLLSIVKPLNRL